jgi:hypothetical protein
MRDTSDWAVTPALGYAAQVISACVLIFLGLIAFIFWLGGLVEKPALVPKSAQDRREVLVEAGGD